MKRSAHVPLSLVSTLASAALAAGCGSQRAQAEGWQTCVDQSKGVVAQQQQCDDDSERAVRQPGYAPHYYWYYHPRGFFGTAPGLGMPIPFGGTYAPTRFTSVPMADSGSHSGSIVRGGFGSTAAGHAGAGA